MNSFFAFFAPGRILLSLLLLGPFLLAAQPAPTAADLRFTGFAQRQSLTNRSLLNNEIPTSIGPAIFSCRVTDVDVNPADPTQMYVAYASGGLWYSASNGTHFDPVFDHEAAMTIGDIAVDWTNNILWVGTGEANSSRSSYAGTGMYRSADGGLTWEWRGLPESHHIARIILHPTNPDILWVAVLGHLYTPNAERGVYKTTDGGKTWNRTLFVDDKSGAVDLVLDPSDPNTLYAATWQRERHAWNFDGAGEGSGIWKSTDAGSNWARIASSQGFPGGAKIGRIGLCAGLKDGKTVLYASVDNQNSKPKKDVSKTSDNLTKDQLRTMTKADFLLLNDDKIGAYLKTNDFPKKYTVKKVREMMGKNEITPLTLVEYLEDANSNLFETDFIGAEVYRSDDGGLTWYSPHSDALELMHFTYGYYFSNIRCLPNNADQVYMLGYLIVKSDDGGKTWDNINGDNVHADHHALWLDAAHPGHLINGNDGGLNISWDNGTSWMKCNNPPVGQLYAIAVDAATPYNVYGGAQDNGVWTGSSAYVPSPEWQQTGQNHYKSILGGDGMQVQVDTRDNNTVYTGFQFGNYFRIDKTTGDARPITPQHDLGERPLRFNWQTPIHLSRHNQDVLYLGAQKLYRSFDRGEHWEALSADLTGGGQKGNVPYGTLTTIHESPLKFGLLYTGSDDGLVQVTRDGGETWVRISDSLPQKMWVSRVQASAHDRARVYVSLSGYRWDDFTAYLYVSDDYGRHWKQLGADLPAEPINVVREDPVNQNVLYVGTDHNIYVSLDRGQSFQVLTADFPHVPVHDLVLQTQTNELVIGTHGRSMYKVDVAHIQALTASVLADTLFVFELEKRKFSKNWGAKQPYTVAQDPELPVSFYVNTPGQATWTVKAKESGLVLHAGEIGCFKGLNTFVYTLNVRDDQQKKYREAVQAAQKDPKKALELEKADTGKLYLRKGVYTFVLEKGGKTETQDFTIE